MRGERGLARTDGPIALSPLISPLSGSSARLAGENLPFPIGQFFQRVAPTTSPYQAMDDRRHPCWDIVAGTELREDPEAVRRFDPSG